MPAYFKSVIFNRNLIVYNLTINLLYYIMRVLSSIFYENRDIITLDSSPKRKPMVHPPPTISHFQTSILSILLNNAAKDAADRSSWSVRALLMRLRCASITSLISRSLPEIRSCIACRLFSVCRRLSCNSLLVS